MTSSSKKKKGKKKRKRKTKTKTKAKIKANPHTHTGLVQWFEDSRNVLENHFHINSMIVQLILSFIPALDFDIFCAATSYVDKHGILCVLNTHETTFHEVGENDVNQLTDKDRRLYSCSVGFDSGLNQWQLKCLDGQSVAGIGIISDTHDITNGTNTSVWGSSSIRYSYFWGSGTGLYSYTNAAQSKHEKAPRERQLNDVITLVLDSDLGQFTYHISSEKKGIKDVSTVVTKIEKGITFYPAVETFSRIPIFQFLR